MFQKYEGTYNMSISCKYRQIKKNVYPKTISKQFITKGRLPFVSEWHVRDQDRSKKKYKIKNISIVLIELTIKYQ